MGRLRTKACFFVSSISVDSKEASKAFSDMGLARQLLVLLQQEEHKLSDEHVVKALFTLLSSDKSAQIECKNSPELNLAGLIQSRKEEFQEELEYYLEIEKLCYNNQSSESEANR